ncbi:MAG: DUF547 domain-containing protein [Candidatus Pelagadaptatus aseana]|uniref:DUF547 domain-containing protein n=1 Tax=Candidatus Pelagadaptatus aseana TaxID=3120508 RepID=UPI0039B1ABFB
MRGRIVGLLGWCVVCLLCSQVAVADFDHRVWHEIVNRHVVVLDDGRASQVDYQAIAKERPLLRRYLKQLEQVAVPEFDQWDRPVQLAFLINAYNAWTVELILSRYPHLDSIKDIGSWFSSPWRREFIPLLGQRRSLDDIEHGLIRGSDRYNEPRIHFAVNCASIGCPALLAEAFEGHKLDQQLEQATQNFLKDASRNRFRDGELQVSKIFDWYQQDFAEGWRGSQSLAEFLALYGDALGLSEVQRQALVSGDINIEFLDYDWGLNDVRPR